MNNQDSQNLDEYFKKALNLEIPIPSDLSLSPASKMSSMMTSFQDYSPPTEEVYYHPRALLDMNWNDGDDDLFMLSIFKKVFACQDRLQSVDQLAKTSTPLGSKNDTINWESDNRLFAPSNTTSFMVTEYVSVPTCKHVAQILGKKGSKIRALRETTNTYIRSPLPREESVFIVKGKMEDVFEAVKAIKSASDFFTSLENEKELSHNVAITSSQGQDIIVVKFSIPECYVGLVVGVKGVTIKEIEKQTKAYIQSPTMDAEPIFTITGSPENCEKAMNLISRYLVLRGVGPGTVECIEDPDSSRASTSSTLGCNYFFTWIKLIRPKKNH